MSNGKVNEQKTDLEELARKRLRAAAVLAMHRIIDAGIAICDHQIAEMEGASYESDYAAKWVSGMTEYHKKIISWLSHLRTTHWPVIEILEAFKIHGVTGE